MKVTESRYKNRQLHIEDYLQMVSAEQKEYAEVFDYSKIAEKSGVITDYWTNNRETANRKWVDWEIYASLRPYGERSRNGLLGIYLPTAGETPARLQDNIDSGYAVTMKWENISWQLESKIEEAYNNRNKSDLARNSRKRRERNS